MHYPSTQNLAYQDSRNLNRMFPGRPDGNLTERTAYAISELIRREKIDMTIDVHEASLGYPVVSTYVCHQRADEMCMMASMVLSAEQFPMKTETSPKSLRGLTHREIGDFTDSFAVLMETPEPFIDKFVGPMTEDLMLDGRDEFMQTAATRGLLYTDYDIKTGASLDYRVGRHLAGAAEVIKQMGEFYPAKALRVDLADLRRGDEARHRRVPARPGQGGSAAGVSELDGLGDSGLGRARIMTHWGGHHETTFESNGVGADGAGGAPVGPGRWTRARFSASAGRRWPTGRPSSRTTTIRAWRTIPLRIVPAQDWPEGATRKIIANAHTLEGGNVLGTMPQVEAHVPLLHVALLVHEREGRGDCRIDLQHRHDDRARQEGQGRDVDEGRRPRRLLVGCRTWRSSAPRPPARPCR